MIKTYENLTGKTLKFSHKGGVVVIPAQAKSFELEESLAKIFQARTYVTVLRESTPIENPVVEESVQGIDYYEEFTKAELRAFADERKIKYVARDSKPTLIKRLRGE